MADAIVRVVENRATVVIPGVEALAPLVSATQSAADEATAARDEAQAATVAAHKTMADYRAGADRAQALQAAPVSGNLQPLVVDADGKVLDGIEASGRSRLIESLLTGSGVRRTMQAEVTDRLLALCGYAGTGSVIPLLTDADDRVLIGYDIDKRHLVGDVDVPDAVFDQFLRKDVSPRVENLWGYSGSGAVVPILTDDDGRILLGWNIATDSLTGVGLGVGAAPAVQTPLEPLPTELRIAHADVLGFVSYGQSLSIGAPHLRRRGRRWRP